MVGERSLVDERSNAKWVERMVRNLRAAPRSKSRLRVLPRRAVRLRVALQAVRLRVAPRRLLVDVSQEAGSTALERQVSGASACREPQVFSVETTRATNFATQVSSRRTSTPEHLCPLLWTGPRRAW